MTETEKLDLYGHITILGESRIGDEFHIQPTLQRCEYQTDGPPWNARWTATSPCTQMSWPLLVPFVEYLGLFVWFAGLVSYAMRIVPLSQL